MGFMSRGGFAETEELFEASTREIQIASNTTELMAVLCTPGTLNGDWGCLSLEDDRSGAAGLASG